jgi:hypothetical protein
VTAEAGLSALAAKKFESIGGWLIAVGCVWFVFVFFWPPVVVVLSWFNPPEAVYSTVIRAEFAMSAALVAVGILLRRRAVRRLSPADYMLVLLGSTIPVLVVFSLNGWIHLRK